MKIELFDGERRVDESMGPEAEFNPSFEPGFHPVYAIAQLPDGPRFSMLHTLIVREARTMP